MRSVSLVSLGILAIYVVQVALLVSTPVYDRTRKDRTALTADISHVWPFPPNWMAPAALAAGLIITVLFLGNMDTQPVPGCGGRGYLAPHSAPMPRCGTLAEGYPIHYLSADPSLSLYSGNKITAGNLDLFANPDISKGAAAEDAAIWTLLSFTACYLIWLPQHRQEPAATNPYLVPA